MAPFNELLDVFTHRATESEVLVEICDMSQGRIRAFQAELHGPYCERAQTLRTTFRAERCQCEEKVSHFTTLLVTDPCYWTPQLPQLYDLQLALELADGTTTEWKHTIGLRRWEIEGRNLFRERKRTVVRGVTVADLCVENLQAAVKAEVALVVRDPSKAFLQRASELGVPLVVDLRGVYSNISHKLLSYAWQPAVVLALPDLRSVDFHYQPRAVKTGCVIHAADSFDDDSWADVIVIELNEAERPPDWAATCQQPVIAIRCQEAYADLQQARRGCDRLQADLAPQFDLAGYIV